MGTWTKELSTRTGPRALGRGASSRLARPERPARLRAGQVPYRELPEACAKQGSFQGDIDIDVGIHVDVDVDVQVDVDIGSYFGCVKGVSKKIEVLLVVQKQSWY